MGKHHAMEEPANYRPETYWDGGATVQGDATFGRVAAATPAGGGEYLPPLEPDEVEIVLIGMETVNGDAISIRARRDGDRIVYRVVDEQELGYGADGPTEYIFQPTESKKPLTFKEVTDLLWSLESPGWRLFESQWEQDALSGNLSDEIDGFFSLSSDFYDGLDQWLAERYRVWLEGK